MRAPLAFGVKLGFVLAVSPVLFFVGHSVNGRPEPDIHAVQNAVLALLGTWALVAVAEQARLGRWLWRAGALLALLAPAVIAVTQATEAGTLHGVGLATAAFSFAVFGHGAGAMARDWQQCPADEDPLKRIALVVLSASVAAVAVRFLIAPLPGANLVSWAAASAAIAGVAMGAAAPGLSSGMRGRLTLQGLAVAGLMVALFGVFAARGHSLMVWGPILFLASYAEARWRPARAAGAAPAR